ncbi:aldehyde dehydrogenase family protein [Kocuria coralli]|uniref:L-glutamate gamma-semialdehyde dehydrogenase n=1 Tax=Kocuria coralli TaxID=1461025 RepID=A0A5J5KUI0_9MICC|nr:bifunctional proline dehydrogenase/L-glutamate gamma-semialdehyde dehydrogenase [Kocuria coralli]KAA9393313.1 aldehyde dehydrogenase family protein [Kocuria coralli]
MNDDGALAGLADLVEPAIDQVETWLRRAEQLAQEGKASSPGADRLAAILKDPKGLEFTTGFVDRVIRTEDSRAAAKALQRVSKLAPRSLSALDRSQIVAGGSLSRLAPAVVIPVARGRLRQMVGHLVIDARPAAFGKAIARLTERGNPLNINLLGEEVLGGTEADKHLADVDELLDRDDVDYASIKVSSVVAQLSHWGFEGTVERVVERLLPLYTKAAAAPAGTKFINLDMEFYSDLHLTTEVFIRLLSRPELSRLEAGIVVQAYLPDALGAIQRLSAWAARRVADGGAQVKVRLVKGANLALEHVDAEIHDWPLATMDSKQSTDANYKRVLAWAFTPDRLTGLRIGVAGHNLFDIAFAHLLAEQRGVGGRIEFEMLQGMAVEQSVAVSEDLGPILLYVPAVRPAEFDVAVSYLVRRLEENAASENFMSGIFELAPGNEVFEREAGRFRTAVDQVLAEGIATGGEGAPEPHRLQDRAAEEQGGYRGHIPLDEPFANEPDTDVSVPANQRWAQGIAERVTDRRWFRALPLPEDLDEDGVAVVVEKGRYAARQWRARGARERAEILNRAADLLGERRSHLLAVAAAETGKALPQGDPEVSEAMDFCRWYARKALELEQVDGAVFDPDTLVLVTPPWNFPLAIPCGSTVAALAVGAAVIHKPSPQTRRCSAAILEALWDAGVPRDVLQLVEAVEGDTGKSLVTHPGVDRIVLTGAYETAELFGKWRTGRPVTGETSGKNALVVTPAADRDKAVWDLVTSAFGHAGQKCSAASLGILVGSVGRSERFERQLLDAAESMVVDWPQNLQAVVGPVIEEPEDKLRRALTQLDDGEEWLLEPRRLDDTGRLWRPGIKKGVRPGSFFHLTEVFGPVLGLMEAKDLDQALEWQNAVDYGLTAGIHSLDTDEIRQWLERVEAGNLYVNRGITGAIVQRQPFGGWKRSSVGLGAKSGGPNYLAQLGTWYKAGFHRETPGSSSHPVVDEVVNSPELGMTLPEADIAWLRACAAVDQRAWDEEFGVAKDPTALTAEVNLFRYRPRRVVVRAAEDAPVTDVVRVGLAAGRSGSHVVLSPSPRISDELPLVARKLFAAVLPASTDEDFREQALSGTLSGDQAKASGHGAAGAAEGGIVTAEPEDLSAGARIKLIGSDVDLVAALGGTPEIAVLTHPVVGAARVELMEMLHEQAVSMTMHRFGNPFPDMELLKTDLMTTLS